MAELTTSWEPLTPLSLLERSGAVFADRTAFVDGAAHVTYREAVRACPPPRRCPPRT